MKKVVIFLVAIVVLLGAAYGFFISSQNNNGRVDIYHAENPDSTIEVLQVTPDLNYNFPDVYQSPEWKPDPGQGAIFSFTPDFFWKEAEIVFKAVGGDGYFDLSFLGDYRPMNKSKLNIKMFLLTIKFCLRVLPHYGIMITVNSDMMLQMMKFILLNSNIELLLHSVLKQPLRKKLLKKLKLKNTMKNNLLKNTMKNSQQKNITKNNLQKNSLQKNSQRKNNLQKNNLLNSFRLNFLLKKRRSLMLRLFVM